MLNLGTFALNIISVFGLEIVSKTNWSVSVLTQNDAFAHQQIDRCVRDQESLQKMEETPALLKLVLKVLCLCFVKKLQLMRLVLALEARW